MIANYFKNVNFLRKNILAAALVPIAVIAIYNWFVSPHLQYLKAAQKYEYSADRVEKNNKMIDAQVRAGRLKLNELSQQFEQKKQEFFDIESARGFLDSIQSRAEKSKCVVDALKFLPTKQIAVSDGNSVDIQQYQATLTVTGQYHSIVKLLDSLQSGKQKVWIDSINLHLKDQASGLIVCDMSLGLYTLKAKEIVSDVNDKK